MQTNPQSYLHDASQLVSFIFPWEQWVACVQLCYDTAQAPHVNSHSIRMTKNHLGGAIKAALNIGVHWIKDQTRSKMSQLGLKCQLQISQQSGICSGIINLSIHRLLT